MFRYDILLEIDTENEDAIASLSGFSMDLKFMI